MGGIDLAPLKVVIQTNIDKFKSDLNTMCTVGVTKANELSKSLSNIEKAGEGFKKVGAKINKYIVAPLIAGLGIAGKFSMDFEESINKVHTISDDSEVPIQKLRKGIIDLSNQTGVSSVEIANNVYDAISAGQKTGDAVNFVANSTKLAKAGFASAGDSLDILTTIMNAYGLKANEVNSVSDTLIQTQNLGKVTVGELSQNMGKVIPTAKAFGVNLGQLATGYALMTTKGIKSAEATTYMNQLFSELGKNGTVANKALVQASGKTFPQLMKSGKSLGDVLNIMNTYAENNGKSLSDMFGSVEAGKAALVLAGGKGKDFNDMLGKMGQKAGATDAAFKKMASGTGQKLKKSLNELKNSLLGFGDALAPFISKISEFISKIAKKLSGLSDKTKKFLVKAALITVVVAPIIGIIGTLLTTIQSAIGIFGALSGVVASAGGAMALLTSPIGICIGIIAALAIAVATNFGGIRDTIKSILGNLGDFITNFWNVVKSAWENDFMGIQSYTQAVWQEIQIIFTTVLNVINGLLQAFSCAFKGDWQGCWEAVKGVASSIWEGIKSMFSTFLDGLVNTLIGIGASLAGAAAGAFQALWNAIKSVWASITGWFSSASQDPVKAMQSVGSALYSAGAAAFQGLWNGMKSVWSGLISWVGEKVNAIKEKFAFWKGKTAEMGGAGGADGSHFNGLSYVPFDGYVAHLHKGERVLTAEENKAFNNGNTSTNNINVNFNAPVDSPSENVRRLRNMFDDMPYVY